MLGMLARAAVSGAAFTAASMAAMLGIAAASSARAGPSLLSAARAAVLSACATWECYCGIRWQNPIADANMQSMKFTMLVSPC